MPLNKDIGNENFTILFEKTEAGSAYRKGIVANVPTCGIVVSEFKHQWHNYFRTNTLNFPPATG